MKTLLLPLLLAISLLAGCASAPRNVYKTAAAGDMTVSSAHIVFSDLVAQKKVSPETVALANKALDTYKAAEMLLLDAGEAYQKTGDKAPMERATAALVAAQGDFLALVQPYIVKGGAK
jgi:hypothetical protein